MAINQTYDDGPAGMTCFGVLPPERQALLQRVLEEHRSQMGEAWAKSAARQEIFWINLWQRSAADKPKDFAEAAELDRWTRELVAETYAGEGAQLDGYGFIINPVGSRAQPWHVDYTMDYSTLFIPLSRLTTHNCTQYAVLPDLAPEAARRTIAANLNIIDFDTLTAACDYVSVRQLLARPYSVVRMGFGTVHRGVANTGDFERVMFWVSVSRSRELLPVEPTVEVIH